MRLKFTLRTELLKAFFELPQLTVVVSAQVVFLNLALLFLFRPLFMSCCHDLCRIKLSMAHIKSSSKTP